VNCDTCAKVLDEKQDVTCASCVEHAEAAATEAATCDEAHCSDHGDFDPAATVRSWARRGQLFATMSKETIDALEELADRIEQGEPVS
jgi:hypothetical protein